jgi:hypothetical protein
MKLDNKNKEIDFDLFFSELLIYSAEYATKWNYIVYYENYIIAKVNEFIDTTWNLGMKFINMYESFKLSTLLTYNRYRDCRGRDRIIVGSTTNCALSAYHH